SGAPPAVNRDASTARTATGAWRRRAAAPTGRRPPETAARASRRSLATAAPAMSRDPRPADRPAPRRPDLGRRSVLAPVPTRRRCGAASREPTARTSADRAPHAPLKPKPRDRPTPRWLPRSAAGPSARSPPVPTPAPPARLPPTPQKGQVAESTTPSGQRSLRHHPNGSTGKEY